MSDSYFQDQKHIHHFRNVEVNGQGLVENEQITDVDVF